MAHDPNDETFVVRRHEDITIVRVKVPNLSNPAEVKLTQDFLNDLVARGAYKLVLDLKYVTLYGSQALGMFVELARTLNAKGGKLVLSHPEKVMPMLEQTKLLRILDVAADPKAASKKFGDTL